MKMHWVCQQIVPRMMIQEQYGECVRISGDFINATMIQILSERLSYVKKPDVFCVNHKVNNNL
jgi:hypothetical protein